MSKGAPGLVRNVGERRQFSYTLQGQPQDAMASAIFTAQRTRGRPTASLEYTLKAYTKNTYRNYPSFDIGMSNRYFSRPRKEFIFLDIQIQPSP